MKHPLIHVLDLVFIYTIYYKTKQKLIWYIILTLKKFKLLQHCLHKKHTHFLILAFLLKTFRGGAHLRHIVLTVKRGRLYCALFRCSSTSLGVTQMTCCPFQYLTMLSDCSVVMMSFWAMLVMLLLGENKKSRNCISPTTRQPRLGTSPSRGQARPFSFCKTALPFEQSFEGAPRPRATKAYTQTISVCLAVAFKQNHCKICKYSLKLCMVWINRKKL